MYEATVNEFPFVAELPRREKSKLSKLWDQFQEMKRLTAEKGMLLPPVLVAELLDMSRQRVHELIASGQFESIRVNGRVFVSENSLVAWAQAEHKSGRPVLVKVPTLKEAVGKTKRYMAAEREARHKR